MAGGDHGTPRMSIERAPNMSLELTPSVGALQ